MKARVIKVPLKQLIGAVESDPSPLETHPTEGQKRSGKYRKGHVKISGLSISVENRAGSTRNGRARNGRPWAVTMASHYGYIKGTVGADGDHVDVIIKPWTPANWQGTVFIVNQVNPGNRRFDEHKAVLGASSEAEARAIYAAGYHADWKGLGDIQAMPFAEFKRWAFSRRARKRLELAAIPNRRRSIGRIDRIIELMANSNGSREFAPDHQNKPKFRKSWPKLAEVRYRKDIHEQDVDRGATNYLKAAGAGALAGIAARGALPRGKRALAGAAAGLGAEGLIREIGGRHRDYYGDRTLTAKRSELLPAAAGIAAAGVLGLRRLKRLEARPGRLVQLARDEQGDLSRQRRKLAYYGTIAALGLGGAGLLLHKSGKLAAAEAAAKAALPAPKIPVGRGTVERTAKANALRASRGYIHLPPTAAAVPDTRLAKVNRKRFDKMPPERQALAGRLESQARDAENFSPEERRKFRLGFGKVRTQERFARRLGRMIYFGLTHPPTAANPLLLFGGVGQMRDDNNRFVDPLGVAAGMKTAYTRRRDGSYESVNVPITHGQVLRSAYQRGHTVKTWGSRVGGLVRDVGDVVTGKARRQDEMGHPQRREWEKSWFKKASGAAVAGAGVLAGAAVLRHNPKARSWVASRAAGTKKFVNSKLPDFFPTRQFSEEDAPFLRSVIRLDIPEMPLAIVQSRARRLLGNNFVRSAAVGGAALGGAGALSAGLMPDNPNKPRVQSAAEGAVKDGIFGAALYGATEPLFKKALRTPVLASRRLPRRLVQFDSPPEDHSRLRRIAGTALAGAGVATLPAALPVLRIQGRRLLSKAPKTIQRAVGHHAEHEAGLAVADYLRSAERVGKSPLGPFLGAASGRQIAQATKGRGVLGRKLSASEAGNAHFTASHWRRFTIGGKTGHEMWDWEVGGGLRNRAGLATHYDTALNRAGIARHELLPSRRTPEDVFHAGRRKVHAEVDRNIATHGDDYHAAIQRIATTTKDRDVRGYFRALATDKAKPSAHYARIAAASPAAIAGAAALSVSGRKKEGNRVNFERGDMLYRHLQPARLYREGLRFGKSPERGSEQAGRVARLLATVRPIPQGWNPARAPMRDARSMPLAMAARIPLVMLDGTASNWDVRDARGRSARVFAPGSRRRVRREKEWHEQVGNQRKLLAGLAVAGTVGGVAAGRYLFPKRIAEGEPAPMKKIIDATGLFRKAVK